MPQIWPMNWVLLFMTFILTLLVFLVAVYFFKTVGPVGQALGGSVAKSVALNWKW